MLNHLSIRNIVLIEKLDLAFSEGLSVLTGETGAGKSILLDALGLALGLRADAGLVRQGCDKGSVTATFDIDPAHPVHRILDENELEGAGEEVILRRSITAEGRSRAFINDQAVSVALLRQVAELIVEIHGQHDERGLLNHAGHQKLLDTYGGHDRELKAVRDAHRSLRDAEKALKEIDDALDQARADEDWLRHAVEELAALDPQPGEEEELALARAAMQQGQRLASDIGELVGELSDDGGAEAKMRGALRRLERLNTGDTDLLDDALAALERASIEASEALAALERLQERIDHDPGELERIEERLFELRGLARKHSVQPDALADLSNRLSQRLGDFDQGADRRAEAALRVDQCREGFRTAIKALSSARQKAAETLDAAVNAELAPLKLGSAKFRTALAALEEADWSASGAERVAFEVATNPNAPFGPIIKIASGGELARFILALKVSLAQKATSAVLVFDEVDRGIGGATAAAVGERLLRLADNAQVLVITHSPQVAARGHHHWRIAKADEDGAMRTSVAGLGDDEREEEIARMLAGAEVTSEARAAARSLLTREVV